jgi:outer membrane receptor protein involved in Fe transport
VPTDAFASLQNNKVLNYLKLRLGYGSSAGYPDPYQTRNILGTGTNAFVTPGGRILNTNTVSDQLGNRRLTAEKHTELEVGVEARFLDNRIGVDLSLYNKQSSDLIIALQLDPATGATNTTVNAADLENKGIELGLNFVPVRGDFTWDFTLNYTRNRNFVNAIAEGVDQVLIGDGFSNLGNFAIPGEQYGVIQGLPFQRNAAGELLVGGDGNYLPGQAIEPIGNPNPNFQANWINNFSYKGLSLGFQFSYVDGGDIYSITTGTMLARGLTEDSNVDRFLPIVQPGVLASDGSTPNNIQGYIGDFFFNSYFFADEGLIFDATAIRLREISLSYRLPKSLLAKTPFGSASLILSGENLWYNAPNFPEFTNFDPEVLSLGVGNGRGFDFLTGPTTKKYGVTLNLTF